MVTPDSSRRRARAIVPLAIFLAVGATLPGCASGPERGKRAGAAVPAAAAEDPEEARREREKVREERRRVVDSTLVWIVAETEARAAGAGR